MYVCMYVCICIQLPSAYPPPCPETWVDEPIDDDCLWYIRPVVYLSPGLVVYLSPAVLWYICLQASCGIFVSRWGFWRAVGWLLEVVGALGKVLGGCWEGSWALGRAVGSSGGAVGESWVPLRPGVGPQEQTGPPKASPKSGRRPSKVGQWTLPRLQKVVFSLNKINVF